MLSVTAEDLYSDDFAPAFNNLYTVEIFKNSEKDSKISTDDLNNYIKFQATNVSFGEETLNLKRHPVSKTFYVENFERCDFLKITWRENEYWKIKKYHENWLGKFYNKSGDYFISYNTPEDAKNELYRNFRITLPHLRNENTEIIYFKSVLPKTAGSFNLQWNQNPGIIQHEMSYYVQAWEWLT